MMNSGFYAEHFTFLSHLPIRYFHSCSLIVASPGPSIAAERDHLTHFLPIYLKLALLDQLLVTRRLWVRYDLCIAKKYRQLTYLLN